MRTFNSILHAEDDPDIQFLMEIAFEDLPLPHYTSFDNGELLLQHLAENELPDIILLDMMMPIMNGIETLAALKTNVRTKHVPVVFLTAKVQPDEVEVYKEKGAAGVMFKPFDPVNLPKQLEQLWREHISTDKV